MLSMKVGFGRDDKRHTLRTKKTPEEFGKFIAAETAKWGRVVKEAGIRAE